MAIRVVSKYKEPDNVWCGRPTPVGNPFSLKDEGDRDIACDKYEEWFYDKILDEDPKVMMFLDMLAELATLGDLNLGCVCEPRRCHTETIKEYLDQWLYGTEECLNGDYSG